MLTYILIAIAIVVFAYVKRHGFRRAWYILRTGAENPDWEKLGGDYFRRGLGEAGFREKGGLADTSGCSELEERSDVLQNKACWLVDIRQGQGDRSEDAHRITLTFPRLPFQWQLPSDL